MTPARVRFTGFLARNYRARSFTLAHSDGWWVCEIDKSGKFRNRIDQLARSVYHVGRLARENHSTNGKSQEPSTENSIPPGSPS